MKIKRKDKIGILGLFLVCMSMVIFFFEEGTIFSTIKCVIYFLGITTLTVMARSNEVRKKEKK